MTDKNCISTPPDKGLKKQLADVEKEILRLNQEVQRLQAKQQNLLKKREVLRSQIQNERSKQLSSLEWDRTDHTWSKDLAMTMVKSFKIKELRPYQLSTMNATLSGHDCILIMPTGGGKSLCFQLPALLSTGVTLVVSPLVSLMEDQCMALHSLELPAEMLSAGRSRSQVNNILKTMTETKPSFKILYVTPEMMAKSKRFKAKLQKMYEKGNFARLAIDEVHCCSVWGHDFRPDYKFLGIMKSQFSKVPIIGLTATATSRVVSDVQKILNIQGCLVLKASFNRPNLKYEVHNKSANLNDKIEQLEIMIKGRFKNQSGIIYCLSIKESEELASHLKQRGIKALSYHAQLDSATRSSVHQKWSRNEIQVVVATIAFGMGIDKPDVRFVIHHSMSKSMENFYQESGRAGRDNNIAHCILLYRFADIFRLSTMVFTDQTGLENLYAIVAYGTDSKRCRREIIAQHFEERWESSDCNMMCDHCDPESMREVQQTDCTIHCRTLYEILRKASTLQERLTAQKLVDIWLGKGAPRLRTGTVSKLPRVTCEQIVALMLLEGYLKEEFHFTPYSTISYINTGVKASSVDVGKTRVVLELPTRKRKLTTTSNISLKQSTDKQPSKSCETVKGVSVLATASTSLKSELNFGEWDDIVPSVNEKRTAKKQKIEVITVSE